MKITLLDEDSIRLEPAAGRLTIEAPDENTQYSPFHMLASGLATCIHALLASWAANVDLDAGDLTIDVRWTFAENPHRVARLDVELRWPSLPENRREVAQRAAALCPIHGTLTHPTHVEIAVGR